MESIGGFLVKKFVNVCLCYVVQAEECQSTAIVGLNTTSLSNFTSSILDSLWRNNSSSIVVTVPDSLSKNVGIHITAFMVVLAMVKMVYHCHRGIREAEDCEETPSVVAPRHIKASPLHYHALALGEPFTRGTRGQGLAHSQSHGGGGDDADGENHEDYEDYEDELDFAIAETSRRHANCDTEEQDQMPSPSALYSIWNLERHTPPTPMGPSQDIPSPDVYCSFPVEASQLTLRLLEWAGSELCSSRSSDPVQAQTVLLPGSGGSHDPKKEERKKNRAGQHANKNFERGLWRFPELSATPRINTPQGRSFTSTPDIPTLGLPSPAFPTSDWRATAY